MRKFGSWKKETEAEADPALWADPTPRWGGIKTGGGVIKKELDRYKKLLLKKKEEVLAAMKHIEEDALSQSQRDASGDLSGYTLHMADTATDSYDREFSLGLATNAQQILYDIDEALKRIEEKRFGNCLSCSKPISRRRLTAIPYASLCIECQAKEETKRRGSASSPSAPEIHE